MKWGGIQIDIRRVRSDLFALCLLAATVFVGFSLISYDPADPPARMVFPANTSCQNWCGPLGAQFAHRLRTGIGSGAFFLLFLMATADARLFARRESTALLAHLFGILLALTAYCIVAHFLFPRLGNGSVAGSGGYVGAWGALLLETHFSLVGLLILLGAVFFAGILLTGDLLIARMPFVVAFAPLRWVGQMMAGWRAKRRAKAAEKRPAVGMPSHLAIFRRSKRLAEPTAIATDAGDEATEQSAIKVNPPAGAPSDRDLVMARLEAGSFDSVDEIELPGLDLLEEPEEFPYEQLAKKAQIAAAVLEQAFQEFGLNVRVSEVDTGPVITQFELQLEAGLRLSKITALADDLAIALRVPNVRVVAPIPGRNTVGIEVPNEKQVLVRLRELVENCQHDVDENRIPLFLGKDVSGRPLVVDLTKMPHLLIAGRTGTGKSVCLNTLILSILMTRSPDQVKLLLIDPKMVELSPYRRIPHLMHPVITDMKKAEAVLAWAVDKMEERYDLLARCGVRHLDSYNDLGKEEVLDRLDIDPDSPEADEIPDQMPYLVIVADEMADLMMTSGKDVEGHIIRLAQKSRAVGIHLVLATQKPTVDVITGLIKSNLPARISFQVASRSDSRVVLDEMGADRLLGNGDMLYLAPGTSNLTRAQGVFVSSDEIDGVIDFFSDVEPQYSTELAQLSTTSNGGGKNDADVSRQRDDLYEQAIDVVIREGRGSVSLLQRALGIGYGRGARLIDYMAEDGIVGPYNGSQAREVLFTREQWEAVKSGDVLEESPV